MTKRKKPLAEHATKSVGLAESAWYKAVRLALDNRETIGELLRRLIEAEWQRVMVADMLGEDPKTQP